MCVITNFHLVPNDRNCSPYSQAYTGGPVPYTHLIPEPLNLAVPSWSSSPILGSTSVLALSGPWKFGTQSTNSCTASTSPHQAVTLL